MLIFTYISEKINQRALLGIVPQVWFLACLTAMVTLPTGAGAWSSYAVVTVLLSYPTPHPMQVGWCSRNSNTVRTRTVSAALYNMAVQLQAIIYSNIYRKEDGPEYRNGNTVLLGISAANIVVYSLVKVYYVWRNRSRDRTWDAKSPDEKQAYLDNPPDKGSKRIDFRFAS